VTANPGCLMQVSAAFDRRGAAMSMAHTVEVLDASLRGRGVGSLVDGTPRTDASGVTWPATTRR
jgi:glycolate oxidase iron-sulfur subunit